MREKTFMVRNVPIPPLGSLAHDETHDLRAAIRQATGIQKLIRHHLARVTRRRTASTSSHDAERTRQVMSDLLETLEQNTRALQRALAMRSNRRVLH
jgi:hypothetical protein